MDKLEVYKTLELFHPDGELFEIRAVPVNGSDKHAASGYFTNHDVAWEAIQRFDTGYNIYFVLNVINKLCYSLEQRDRMVAGASSTKKEDIVAIRYLLIDLDYERGGKKISTTAEELNTARLKAHEVRNFLRNQGFSSPVVGISGSGYHLIYKLSDWANTEANMQLIQRFMKALSFVLSDEHVHIDTSVGKANQLDKLYGTVARKGANTAERPHRMSKIVCAPEEFAATSKEYFIKVANILPVEEPNNYSNMKYTQGFNVDEFIAKHGIEVTKDTITNGIRKIVLKECPFNPDHRSPDAALFVMENGALGFRCMHNSCQHYTFKDFRLHYEPDAYDKKDRKEYEFRQRQYSKVTTPFEPVKEIADKGKKWLSMTDIKRVDIAELLSIPTGYTELDKKIIGLFAGELTVVSGLNACVDCDTEYFNGVEWKRISDYTEGEKVLQYNEDGTSTLVYPQRYIKEPCDKLHLVKTKMGVDQCVSDEHRIIYMTSKGNLAEKSMRDLITQHNSSKHGFNGKFYTTFKFFGDGIDLTDEQIRVMCAVICDGHYSNRYADKSIVRLNLKKHNKKERLERLLEEANITYRKEQYNPKDLEYNNYLFKSPRIEKEFTAYWYNCNEHQMQVIADEIMYWDGCISHGSFSSNNKATIDFLQIVFATCGKRTSIYVDDRVGRKHSKSKYTYKKVCYDLNICTNNMVSMVNVKSKTPILDYKTKDGYKYCFRVPSGMLVLRRGGNINITGNSGKSIWLDGIALNVVDKGYKVGIWSGEIQDWRFLGWINQVAAGKSYVCKKVGYDNYYYAPPQYCEKIASWLNGKMFLYNNNYGSRWEQLFADIKELVDTQGVHLVILDNLAALNIDGHDGDKYSKQTKFILELKEYAKMKNIHVILVCHPRKENFFLRKESISGTADLTNIADNLFLIHRVGKDFEKRASEFFGEDKVKHYLNYSTVIEVAKNRQMGVVDYLIGLYYEAESRRLKNEVAEHINYGWQENIMPQSFIEPSDIYEIDEENDPFGGFQGDAPF